MGEKRPYTGKSGAVHYQEAGLTFNGIVCYVVKVFRSSGSGKNRSKMVNRRGRRPFIMKKKEVAAAIALLTASSALCLRLMKKVDEKLRREKEKRTRK